jgi:aminomethyltransferase
MQEHLHCRDNAGLFDVSHMGQVLVSGKGAALALETLMPVDLESLRINQQTYATFTTESGGISDDLIVTRWSEDSFFLVVNAACKEQDIAHLRQHLSGLDINYFADRQLLALQGAAAKEVMAELAPEANSLLFMNGCPITIDGMDCYITRSGYTGEDGFEISVAATDARVLADRLLAHSSVKWIGLGARDSLRLEAGLCLYGHDLTTETSPVSHGASVSLAAPMAPRPVGFSVQIVFLINLLMAWLKSASVLLLRVVRQCAKAQRLLINRVQWSGRSPAVVLAPHCRRL